jgi:hypothetical protein
MHRSVMNITIGVAFLAALGAWLLLRPTGTGSQVAPIVVTPVTGHPEQASALENALSGLKAEVVALKRQQTSGLENALSSLKAEMAALKRQQDHLTRSLRAIEATVARSVSWSGQADVPSKAEEDARTEAGSNTELSEEQQIVAMLDALDHQLSKEPDDPIWSHRAQIELATLLHPSVMQGSQVLSTACHSTLCRVEIEHEDTSTQSWLVDNLPMEPPFDGEILVRQISDDPLAPRTLIYLARPGHSLFTTRP